MHFEIKAFKNILTTLLSWNNFFNVIFVIFVLFNYKFSLSKDRLAMGRLAMGRVSANVNKEVMRLGWLDQ